ncbi:MAG: cyclodeaminase/cyclohydrolase family protein [Candidatus Bipolaricaulota bacterium]|nr:cyclodeaminase/cyclohydrolase family protein [Candidatus Bipolaricaulota bacterium]
MNPASWTDEALGAYLERLASSEPTPGGGSAACVAGALGAGLGSMVVAVVSKKSDALNWAEVDGAFRALRDTFLGLAQDDEEAFRVVMAALRLPKEDPSRPARLQEALERAALVPLTAAERAVDLLRHLKALAPHASDSIASDVGAGAHLTLAALRSSLLNVDVNLRGLKNPERRESLTRRRREIEEAGSALCGDIARVVSARLAPEAPTR